MSDFSLIIGNKTASSWSLRGYLMLMHCTDDFKEVMIPLRTDHTKSEILKYSSAGQVPILIDGDLTVSDSLAIGEYLADRFPEKNLWPQDIAEKAKARMISAEMHSGFKNLRNDMPMYCLETIEAPTISDDLKSEIDRVHTIFLTELRRNRDGGFLFGQFSTADAMFAPVVSRLKTYQVVSENPEDAALLKKYEERIFALPSFAKWREEAALEAPIPRG